MIAGMPLVGQWIRPQFPSCNPDTIQSKTHSITSLLYWEGKKEKIKDIQFVLYFSITKQFYRKIVDFSRIRSLILVVEGEHTGHLTTTTMAPEIIICLCVN